MTYWFAGYLCQGEQITIAAADPALVYGASVFTTMRIYENSLTHPLTAWDWHRDRISQSLHYFDWSTPDWQRTIEGCQALLSHYPVLRLTILADGRELITGRPLPQSLEQQQQQGVTAWVAATPTYRRSLPNHKTGNYLPCWLAMQAAQTYGARDAILTTATGEWLETSTGNLWGYRDSRWWTPPVASGLLSGISRARLIKTLEQDVISNIRWTNDVVTQFECLAYSNCVVELIPIHTVLLGNIKLNYSSTHEGLTALRQMFRRPSLYEHNC